jgi:N utilization substance protein A
MLVEKANVPSGAYEIRLEEFDVSDRLFAVLSEAGFPTVGDLLLQMRLDPDSILRLNGMGPKAMKELTETLDKMFATETEIEESVAAETEELAVAELESPLEEPQAILSEADETVEETFVSDETEPISEVVLESEAAVVAEAEGEIEEVLETVVEAESPQAEEVLQPEISAEPVEQAELPEEEEPSTLDELFALRPDVLDYDIPDEEEDEDDDQDKKKKKKKKKKYVEVEYDPDHDVIIARKKRKRGGLDWDGDW